MSVDLNVYLRRASMPSPKQWAEAIRTAGFPAELDSDFDPDTATGFLPCKFRSVLSGFECRSERLSERDCKVMGAPPGSDFSVTFSTGSDLREGATSVIAASILCHISNGVLFDPQSGEEFPASDVLDWAREQLASLEAELELPCK